jgi:asparagine synthase (glutamine-hydrolysing)
MDATIERAHTIPHFVYPRAEDVFTRASDITWHQDEPFGSTSGFWGAAPPLFERPAL